MSTYTDYVNANCDPDEDNDPALVEHIRELNEAAYQVKLAEVKSCQSCGATMALYALECPRCLHVSEYEDEDNAPSCMDCGHDLDPNGFCLNDLCPSSNED